MNMVDGPSMNIDRDVSTYTLPHTMIVADRRQIIGLATSSTYDVHEDHSIRCGNCGDAPSSMFRAPCCDVSVEYFALL